jgi:hypothetical protein
MWETARPWPYWFGDDCGIGDSVQQGALNRTSGGYLVTVESLTYSFILPDRAV